MDCVSVAGSGMAGRANVVVWKGSGRRMPRGMISIHSGAFVVVCVARCGALVILGVVNAYLFGIDAAFPLGLSLLVLSKISFILTSPSKSGSTS